MGEQWWFCDGCTLYFQSYREQAVCPECGVASEVATCDCGALAVEVEQEHDTGASYALCEAHPACCQATVEWNQLADSGKIGIPRPPGRL